jgi:tight adherence protein C
MELMVNLLVFGSIFLLVLGVGAVAPRRIVQRRLTRLADGSSVEIESRPPDPLVTERARQWLDRGLSVLGERFKPTGPESVSRIRERLNHAGYRSKPAVTRFFGLQVAFAVVFPVLLLLTPLPWAYDHLQAVVMLCLAAAAGFVAPSYWVDGRAANRRMKLDHGMPDALDLMVVCVEAGLGMTASIARVATEFARGNPVLASEFQLVTLEIRAGKGSTEALRSLGARTGLDDIKSLVAMLIQTERFGTSLADTLRVQADSMRTRRLQRAEEAAQRAPIKMLFPTAVLIFPATLMVTVGPGLLQLFAFFGDK